MIGMRAETIVDVVDGITDNIVIFMLVGAGVYFIDKGNEQIGWDMVKIAFGYIAGKSMPVVKSWARRRSGGIKLDV